MKHILLFTAALLGISTANAQMGFTPNQGQFADQNGRYDGSVLFKACGTGPGIYITTSGLTYKFIATKPETDSRAEVSSGNIDWSAIHMNLVGATILAENVVVENELPGVSNYYYPHCPQGIVGVKSYHKITIKNIYPGIDWIITTDDVNGMAHDFLVHGNGDHKNIIMRYSGLTSPITLNEKQQLTLVSPLGTIYEGGLAVKRSSDGRLLTSYFNVAGNDVSFLIHRRNHCGLVIDPPLQWNSLQASSGFDYGYGVAATKDGSGDVLGCGFTDGSDYPTLNATQGTLSGQEDAVIYRLDANGTRLWSTYFGGTDIDNAKGITTDLAGNAYVTGHTNSQDLPVINSLQGNYGGGLYDAFIAKYNNAGVMQWASWRGGTGADFGTAITSDDNGTCYVVGYTNTVVNFPIVNAIQPAKAGTSGIYDGFAMAFTSAQAMIWSTYYGGTDEDKFRSVALDATGTNIAIAGNTMSGNFPTVGTPFQLFNAQAWFTSDAVIVKMTGGQTVLFASYCGGYEDDFAYGVTFDNVGNIYASGYTLSSDFPKVVQAGAYSDTSFNSVGVQDPFIVKCNPSGTTLLWSTYFGGTSSDYGFAITFDQNLGIYVCGNTVSTDFPVMQPADVVYYQPTHGDGGNFNDMWIAWFDINDSLRWSTYFGNSMSNEAYGLSTGMQNEIYMTGVDSNEIAMIKFNPGLPTSTQPVSWWGSTTLTFYPNPVVDELQVMYNVVQQGNSTVQIFDVQGKLVFSEQHFSTSGMNWYAIPVSGLAVGEYTLQISTGGDRCGGKFVKQ